MLTYKQISEKHNIPIGRLYRAVHDIGLKGRYLGQGREKHFSSSEENQMVLYRSIGQPTKTNDRRKIKIIEFYQKHNSGRKVAHILNIDRIFVMAAIREYNQTGFITVESKLNRDKTI